MDILQKMLKLGGIVDPVNMRLYLNDKKNLYTINFTTRTIEG